MREIWVRLDMGNRANALVDNRLATASDAKHVTERFNELRKYAL